MNSMFRLFCKGPEKSSKQCITTHSKCNKHSTHCLQNVASPKD